ncbi:MAG: hypothetical protein LBK53_06060 [Heliobacteriaceae bacterium]|jgi:hypothetical protein|nr:hypothetical protein [Heliobacteriaceae bacterium]
MKTDKINNNKPFTANIGLGLQAASKIVAIQEGGAGLSNIRFIQDTATNLTPRVIFARSKADLVENTFLELTESLLVYYCPALLGEKIFRKLYSKKLSPAARKLISTPANELLKSKIPDNKLLMPVKAALALSCFAIPLVEFTLNYFKNLVTLGAFRQGNFENIANLDKTNKVDKKLNQEVEKSAKKNIKRAAAIYGGCLAASALLIKKGAGSKLLRNVSEAILAPGTKFFKGKEKSEKFLNKYLSLDFADNNGKLTMSRGQLTSCVLVGGAGYFGASKDRGRQNFLETLFRFPLVGFYVISGHELPEKGLKKLLYKNGKCKDLIDKNLNVPKLDELKQLAQAIVNKRGGDYNEVYKKLLRQKTFIAGVPLLFGIGVMGFFVTKSSNMFTKFRYEKEKAKNSMLMPVSSKRFFT